MAESKSIKFLPGVFRTETNKKFLNATLDQLITEPKLKKIYGYIGRMFAPTYKSTDNYLPEIDSLRQNYQLEPSIVIKNAKKETELYVGYIDLLDQIKHSGGLIDNQSRLFENEFYSFDGLIDYDKISNFNNYYWLTNGPDTVSVFPGGVDPEQTFVVTRNIRTNSYNFSGRDGEKNPVIYLMRGGQYKFQVNQLGNKFWLQTESGTAGTKRRSSNISTRDVFGVENNGEDSGEITFTVPRKDAQRYYTEMKKVADVDIATTVSFNEIQGHLLSKIPKGAFDNAYTTRDQLKGRTIIFVNQDADVIQWTPNGTYDLSGYAANIEMSPTYPGEKYDPGELVPEGKRFNIWQIDFYRDPFIVSPVPPGDPNYDPKYNLTDVMVLVPYAYATSTENNLIYEIPTESKVFVKAGKTNANKEYFKDTDGFYKPVPLLTAHLDTIFYQDGTESNFVGYFKLLDQENGEIDVENDILDKISYTSPNGVVFTNGMKIRFEGNIIPSSYLEREFYVERVGIGIRLVDVTTLDATGNYDHYDYDYITINRSSLDSNAWSRNNRWFHIDVIKKTFEYNNNKPGYVGPDYDQSLRARRPIVEFDPDIVLLNHGTVAKRAVDYVIDSSSYILPNGITNAFVEHTVVDDVLTYEVEGAPVKTDLPAKYPDGYAKIYRRTVIDAIEGEIETQAIYLIPDDRVIFANDVDIEVKNKIFRVEFIDVDGDGPLVKQVHLVPTDDYSIEPFNNVLVRKGPNAGKGYWFNGEYWTISQDKIRANQEPLFDTYDDFGISFSNTEKYIGSTFKGTKLFGYVNLEDTGTIDPYLGFTLSYHNFNNIGDIEFTNHFDKQTCTYGTGANKTTIKINTGYLHQTIDLTSYNIRNVWTKVCEPSLQYQNIVYFADETNLYPITVPIAEEKTIPHLKVYQNNKMLLENNDYSVISSVNSNIMNSFVELTVPAALNDKIDILVYSKDVSKEGYYQIPSNLDYNAQNANFDIITLGQLRNHAKILLENGSSSQQERIRDYNIKVQGGNILQHSAPVSHSALFLVHNDLDFISATNYARREYSKFKNKFLESCINIGNLERIDPSDGVDVVLESMNAIKTDMFPWYYSDMIPYGDTKNTISYTIYDPNNRSFEITSIFNPSVPSNKAVLVYHTTTTGKVQLLHGVEYIFDQSKPVVTILETVSLETDDSLTIVEYSNTNGCFIPDTPTKLGLHPKFRPEIYTDSTYINTTKVIKGHDGSITPVFNDLRDIYLLELEKRIYNNIKVEFDLNGLTMYDVVSGKYRNADYLWTEFNAILEKEFLSWVGSNKLDYITNNTFDESNLFTWNYGSILDKEGSLLQGSWRAIYRYYFDTETPHLTPWEMLGFSEKPDWWENEYGPAPYTGGNLVLWEDLSEGKIAAGPRAGIDNRFKRPNLINRIPVSDHGRLLSPNEFLVDGRTLLPELGNKSWQVSECGPAETAWRKSSDFVFSLQIALALAKPARYFGSLVDTTNYKRNLNIDQYMEKNSKQRIRQTDLSFSGNDNDCVSSYINWIAEYLVNLGKDPKVSLIDNLTKYQIQLAYKLAGFSDKSYINVLAEQSSPTSVNDSVIIPDENYEFYLNKSTPIDNLSYSGVIIETTATGYAVQGYDLANPFFIVNKPIGQVTSSIKVLTKGVNVYSKYSSNETIIPYGFEFTDIQQVANFLLGYENALISKGFIFNEFDRDLNEGRNWSLAVKEFLFWVGQGWQIGNILALSPIGNKLTLNSKNSVVDTIEDSANGTKILDQNFNVIKQNEYSVYRDSDSFVLELPNEKMIALASLNLVQYEHALIFDNTTVFNDVIYKPELGSRQFRLKLIGQKTDEWNGRLSPPGFIYNSTHVDDWQAGKDYLKGDLVTYKQHYYTALTNIIAADLFDFNVWKLIDSSKIKTGLLPNFATNAGKAKSYYDVDAKFTDTKTEMYSKGLIGFRNRAYLSDLSLDEETQVKLYQGFIKNKGTKNAIGALLNTKFNNVTGDINYFEEWALRVGEYGALEINQFVEVELDESVVTANPSILRFPTATDLSNNDIIDYSITDTYKHTNLFTGNIILSRESDSNYDHDILTAGYVKNTEIDFSLFDLNNYSTLTANIDFMGSGVTIHAANDFKSDWNVYRITETEINVIATTILLDGVVKITTNKYHQLSKNDIVLIKNYRTEYDGFYKVETITNLVEFTIKPLIDTALLPNSTGFGLLFILKPLRFNYATDLTHFTPMHDWKDGELVWVDNGSTGWTVYEKDNPWKYDNVLVNSDQTVTDNFGHATAISNDEEVILVSDIQNNFVKTYYKTLETGMFDEGLLLSEANSISYGFSIAAGETYFAVGDPNYTSDIGSGKRDGIVYVYKRGVFNTITKIATLVNPGNTNAEYGYCLTMSSDDRWLYISAPGDGAGLVYALQLLSESDSLILIKTLTGEVVDGRFGHSISVSPAGDILVVGAPELGLMLEENTGVAYIYDRGIESFRSSGDLWFTTQSIWTFPDNPLVTVDGKIIERYNDITDNYTITFNTIAFTDANLIPIGSVVSVDLNTFSLLKKIAADDAEALDGFGYSVDICPTTCSVYVGAPRKNSETTDSGAVYRFLNQGRVYGIMTGSVVEPNVSIGHTLRINDFNVRFTGTTLNDVIDDINSSLIPGIFAAATDERTLKITSDVTLNTKKLKLTPGYGTAYIDLGLDTNYVQVQKITHPFNTGYENFGQVVAINKNATTLFVSSISGRSYERTTFDDLNMTFDMQTTAFLDEVKSGAVYVYDDISDTRNTIDYPDKLVYTQQLLKSNMQYDAYFGSSVTPATNFTLVGETGKITNGSVYIFNNITNAAGWNIIRQEEQITDPYSVNKIYLYHKQTRELLAILDWIDPAKGKNLGIAEQEIDYKSTQDPANYNRGVNSEITINENRYWGSKHLGKYWWDLSEVKFLNYEQSDLNYRVINWGKIFPESSIRIYEWIESSVLPSDYPGPGIPKYANNSAYVQVSKFDNTTNGVVNKYYFWVYNKNYVNYNIQHKTLPITSVENIISNPKDQGIPYAVFLQNNALALFNVNSYLSAKDVILHVDYDLIKNSKIIHSEYELVPEGGSDVIPIKIINKLIDSLSGRDRTGNTVPDYSIPKSERYGISIRPRQTMFVNRGAAVKELVLYANQVLIQYPIVLQSNLDLLMAQDPTPLPNDPTFNYNEAVNSIEELAYITTETLSNQYKVLVKNDSTANNFWVIYEWILAANEWLPYKVQSYDATQYWFYTDWYATGYSRSTLVTYTVNNYIEYGKLETTSGDVIKILDSGDGNFNLLVIQEDGSALTVGIGNATIQLSDKLYLNDTFGFDTNDFDTSKFDQNVDTELRYIVRALYQDIFVNELADKFNGLFFALMNYVLSEQQNLDWIFKTSFISVLHKLRKLDQFPNYIKDNQDYYRDYIDEVKPYKTKVREYLIDYEGSDTFGGDVTDFDLPPYYDTLVEKYRSPSGEYEHDTATWQTSPYDKWYKNYTYSIESITVERPGTGFVYPDEPTITISGGGGSGAAARAIVNFSTGEIESFEMLSQGSGYTHQPNVTINGSGIAATAYANLKDDSSDVWNGKNPVRKIATTIAFDRYSFTSNVTEWQANTMYYAANANIITKYNSISNVRDAYIIKSNNNIFSNVSFNTEHYQKISTVQSWKANTAYTANTVIKYASTSEPISFMSNSISFWKSNSTIKSEDINLNFFNLYLKHGDTIIVDYKDEINKPNKGRYTANVITANTITVLDSTAEYEANTDIGFNSLQDAVAGANILLYSKKPIVSSANYYITNTDFVSGNIFTTANLTQIGNGLADMEATDRIMAWYQPGQNQIPRTLQRLIPGIDYPGIIVDGVKFQANVHHVTGNILFTKLDANIGSITSNTSIECNLANLFVEAGSTIMVIDAGTNSNAFIINSIVSDTNITILNSEIVNGYSNATIYSWNGADEGPELDVILSSYFANVDLGSNIADYNTVGGQFIDMFSSHTPEELVPGSMYDHLNMQVYVNSSPTSNATTYGYRIEKNMNDYYRFQRIAANSSVYVVNNAPAYGTDIIVISDPRNLTIPDVDRGLPGVVYINGERIVYWELNFIDGSLRRLQRGTEGTGANIHLAGSLVIDASHETEFAQIGTGTRAEWFDANLWFGDGTEQSNITIGNSDSGIGTFLRSEPAWTL